jgi:HprK-related kinase B
MVTPSPFADDAPHELLAVLLDVTFVSRSNDAGVIAQLGRIVQRYRSSDSQAASGAQQTLVCIQGMPEVDLSHLRDVPRRSGGKSRVGTIELPGGRLIYHRESGVATSISPDHWTVTGDLQAHPGEVVRALDAMLSLALVDRGYLTLKGSALVRDGRGIALVGGPDGARRALAVTLVGRGCRWTTEDLLLVRVASGHVEMRGLPGLLRLGPGAMLAHPALYSLLTDDERTRYAGRKWRELREIDTRYVVDAAEAFGAGGIAEGGALQMIAALRWKASAEGEAPSVTALTRSDAYEVLADATRSYGMYDLSGTLPPNFHRLQRMAETVAMRAVSGPIDLQTAADALLNEDARLAAETAREVTNGAH